MKRSPKFLLVKWASRREPQLALTQMARAFDLKDSFTSGYRTRQWPDVSTIFLDFSLQNHKIFYDLKVFEAGSHVAEAGLELLRPSHPNLPSTRVTTYSVHNVLLVTKPKVSCMLGKHSTSWVPCQRYFAIRDQKNIYQVNTYNPFCLSAFVSVSAWKMRQWVQQKRLRKKW